MISLIDRMSRRSSFSLKLLPLLRCPYCGGDIAVGAAKAGSADQIEWGILFCSRCENRYPVAFGIPIFKMSEDRVDVMAQTKDKAIRTGPKVAALVTHIEAGQFKEAAQSLLFAPPKPENLAPRWFLKLPGQRFLRPFRKAPGRLEYLKWYRESRSLLDHPGNDLTAMKLIDFYHRRFTKEEIFYYFAYRFGQPRHLTALAFARLFADTKGPILDLACGAGHLSYFLSAQAIERIVFGLDRNFFPLFVAKKFVSPSSNFICAEADHPLPFAGQTFTGVFCSDAFHCFPQRAACVREIKRIIEDDGLIALTRFGNSLVEPREGYELDPQAYKALFSDRPHTIVGEDAVLKRYLNRLGPSLGKEDPIESLNRMKWLSLVATEKTDIFVDHGEFQDWPHALGRLKINPLYHRIKTDAQGNETYEFRFPSKWYRFENDHWNWYAPAKVSLSRPIMAALENGERIPEMEDLIGRCVILAMPAEY